MHAAAGNAQVQRGAGAKFQRSLQQLHAFGVDLQVEKAAATQEHHGQHKRMVTLAHRKVEGWPAVFEGQLKKRGELDILEREHANRHRRQSNRKASAHQLGRQIEAGSVAKQAGRDELTQLFHKAQVAFELDRLGLGRLVRRKVNRHVGFLPADVAEAKRLEVHHHHVQQLNRKIRQPPFEARRFAARAIKRAHDFARDNQLRVATPAEAHNPHIYVGANNLWAPVEPRDDVRALARGGDVRRAVCQAAQHRRQQRAQVEHAKQLGGVGREKLLGIERVGHGVFDAPGQRPDRLRQRANRHIRRGDATGLLGVETHAQALRVAQRVGHLRENAIGRARALRHVVGEQAQRGGLALAEQLLHRRDQHVGGVQARLPECHAGVALGGEAQPLRVKGGVVAFASRRCQPQLLPRHAAQPPLAAVVVGGEHSRKATRLGAKRHKDQRRGELNRLPGNVGADHMELEVLLAAGWPKHHPEGTVLNVGRALKRKGDVGCHQRGQAHARQRHAAVVVRQRAAVVQLGLAHHDVHALDEVGHRRAILLDKAALGHFHQRGAVPERVQVAFVHDPHIVVAALRRRVHPLRDIQPPAAPPQQQPTQPRPASQPPDIRRVGQIGCGFGAQIGAQQATKRGRRGWLCHGIGPVAQANTKRNPAPGRVPAAARFQVAAQRRKHQLLGEKRLGRIRVILLIHIAAKRRRQHHQLVAIFGRHRRHRAKVRVERLKAGRAVGVVVGRPDRAQWRGILARQPLVAVGAAPHQLGMPQLGTPARGLRGGAVQPAHVGRGRDQQAVGQFDRGFQRVGRANCGRGIFGVGLHQRRQRRHKARPVEQAGDAVRDGDFGRHLKDQPARAADPRGGAAGRRKCLLGRWRRRRFARVAHRRLVRRRWRRRGRTAEICRLGNRLRGEMNHKVGGLRRIVDHKLRGGGVARIEPQVQRVDAEGQQVVGAGQLNA